MIFCLFVGTVRAVEIYEPFQSVRQLGMGGVYVFHENDAGSFVQNPAYTCVTEGFNWTLFNAGIGVGDIQSFTSLIEGSGSLPDANSFSALSPFYGKYLWFNAGAFSSFTLPCFGFAATYSGLAKFSMHNPAFPQLDTFYMTESGYRIGGGLRISEVLALGMDIKRINRAGSPISFGPDQLANLSASGSISSLAQSAQNEGLGHGLDLGVVSRFSMLPFNPTVSLAWKDVGSTAFAKTKGNDAPDRQKDNLTLGLTFDGAVPLLGIAGGIEYRHITTQGEQIGKKLHLGTELSLAFLDLRAGFHQGYTTYGFGIDLWILQLDAAWYKVERGVYPGQSPDERAQIGLMMELEFDPNFNLTEAGGKKRRLKQRR